MRRILFWLAPLFLLIACGETETVETVDEAGNPIPPIASQILGETGILHGFSPQDSAEVLWSNPPVYMNPEEHPFSTDFVGDSTLTNGGTTHLLYSARQDFIYLCQATVEAPDSATHYSQMQCVIDTLNARYGASPSDGPYQVWLLENEDHFWELSLEDQYPAYGGLNFILRCHARNLSSY